MLKGIDISNHNWNYLASLDFAPLKDKDGFVIMKATEGLTFYDGCVNSYYDIIHGKRDGLPDKDRLYGFYHFARPERGNSAIAEARHFASRVGHHNGNAIYALDIEEKAFTVPKPYIDDWILTFSDAIENWLGVKIVIYIDAWHTDWASKAAKNNNGLWCAKWSSKKPTKEEIKPWELLAFWQDSNGGGRLDTDRFYGNEEQYRAYCKAH